MTQLHTVAVYELGTRLRVLVDGLECPAAEAPATALQTVADLARVPLARIGMRLIKTDDVADVAHDNPNHSPSNP